MSALVWMEKIRAEPDSFQIILGSASVARRNVFSQLQIPFQVKVSQFPEDLPKEGFQDASMYSLATAREKTQHILKEVSGTDNKKTTILVTCDSVIIRHEDDDHSAILEKPESPEHAFHVLQSLSGKTHLVATGVVVTLQQDEIRDEIAFVEKTSVTFSELSEDDIAAYIRSGEPFGKAGSYAIQGLGALLVEKLSGSYDNVVGIPLKRVASSMACLLERNHHRNV